MLQIACCRSSRDFFRADETESGSTFFLCPPTSIIINDILLIMKLDFIGTLMVEVIHEQQP